MSALPALPTPGDLAALLHPADRVVALLEPARAWLISAYDTSAVDDVRAKAAAIEVYCRQRDVGSDAVAAALTIQRRAEVRLGQLIPKQQGKKRNLRTAAQKFSEDELRQFHALADHADEVERVLPKLGDKAKRKTVVREAKAAMNVDRRLARQDRTTAARTRHTAPARSDTVLHVSTCADLLDHIEPATVDAILTDPPYGRAHLGTYDELGALAAVVLRPGGVCYAMAGQTYLPDVVRRLGRHLDYWWTFAYLTHGDGVKLWPRRLVSQWKPVVAFRRPGELPTPYTTTDVARSSAPDQISHPRGWAQSVDGMRALVTMLTEPGWLVCDPFVGSGTTAMAAAAEHRRFIGCDVDAQRVEQTREALACP